MKRFLLFFSIALLSVLVYAQDGPPRPVRTPEEEAMKQTEMLQRELALNSFQYDTIYRIHLKYARMRQISNTRAEMLERINNMFAEILNMLTPEQQNLFMGKQISPGQRRPAHNMMRVNQDSVR